MENISVATLKSPSAFIQNIIVEDNEAQIDFFLEALRTDGPWYKKPEYASLKIFVGIVSSKLYLEKLLQNTATLQNAIGTGTPPPGLKRYLLGVSQGSPDPRFALAQDTGRVINKQNTVDSLSYSLKCRDIGTGNLNILIVPYIPPTQSSRRGIKRAKPLLDGWALEPLLIGTRTSPQSSIYTLDETMKGYGKKGDIWPGPVHYMTSTGRYMAGPRHRRGGHPALNVIYTQNRKVKDLRPLRRIKSETFPSDVDDPRALRKGDFSPLLISRHRDNSTHLVFRINMLNIAKRNTPFRNLFPSDSHLLSAWGVDDIILYRRRVENRPLNNRLTGAPLGNRVYPYDLREIYIASAAKGTLKSLGGFGAQMALIALDEGMKNISDGLYRYGIKVMMKNTAAEGLLNIIKVLEQEFARFKRYIKRSQMRGAYDEHRRQFTDKFIANEELNGDWRRIIGVFASTRQNIVGSPNWSGHLWPLINPATATPRTIGESQETIEKFIASVNEILKPSLVANSESTQNFKSKIDWGDHQRHSLVLKHDFNDAYDASIPVGCGLVYVENFTTDYGAWRSRIAQEVSLYSQANPAAPGTNPYKALSPLRISLPPVNIPVQSGMDLDDSLRILVAKKNPNVELGLDFGPIRNTLKEVTSYKETLINTEGVSLEPLRVTLKEYQQSIRPAMANEALISSADKLGDESKFVNDNTSDLEQISGSTSIHYKGQTTKNENKYRSHLAMQILNQIAYGYDNPKVVFNPQLEGTLADQQMRLPGTLNGINSFELNILYNSVSLVQYFDGSRWTTLSEGAVLQAERDKRGLMCRLRSMSSILQGHENIYKIPTYNEYFVIGKLGAIGTALSVPRLGPTAPIKTDRDDKVKLAVPREYHRSSRDRLNKENRSPRTFANPVRPTTPGTPGQPSPAAAALGTGNTGGGTY